MMDRQGLFSHFVLTVGNKGRAMCHDFSRGSTCAYQPGFGHPGCALGCQPAFQAVYRHHFEGRGIVTLHDIAPLATRALGVETMDDLNFLSALQCLHDSKLSWDDLRLRQSSVDEFAGKFHLNTVEVPA